MQNKFMNQALKLAQHGVGQVAPNPLVGCVIVKDGKIIGKGYHQIFGEAHAEINALKDVGEKARNAEMYVTLEPCCYYGKTPPCTEAILKAGIKKVYIGMLDPNPLVSGKGVYFLRKNGIEVEVGIEEEKVQKLNEKFSYFIQNKSPFVALKLATTQDGKITRSDGEKWITNEKSREEVHHLRNEYEMILVGKNTVLEDNPSLTTYLLENGNNPMRIILDSNLSLPTDKKVFADSNFIIVTTEGKSLREKQKYLDKGGKVLEVGKERINLELMLKKLGEMQVSSLFIEGGAKIYLSFLEQNLVQKIYWFKAPIIAGESALSVENILGEFSSLKNITTKKIGNNTLTIGYFK